MGEAAEVVKVTAHTIPVSLNLLEEAGLVRRAVDEMLDRRANPWKYPDRPQWPTFNSLPRLARLQARYEAWRNPPDWDDESY